MSRFQYTLAGAAALVLLAAGAPRALAFAPTGSGSGLPFGSATHVSSRDGIMLSPIVVNGQRIPMVVALTYLKVMLKRPWSTSAADLDKIVCRVTPTTGSHFDTMRCETNRQHFRTEDKTQASFDKIVFGGAKGTATLGTLYVEVANWVDRRRVNRGSLHEILRKLPPPGSSYTLQVTDHGKVVEKYIIKDGELVQVIKMDQH